MGTGHLVKLRSFHAGPALGAVTAKRRMRRRIARYSPRGIAIVNANHVQLAAVLILGAYLAGFNVNVITKPFDLV